MGQDLYLDYVGKKTSILHQCEIHANPPERERTSQEAGVLLACDFVDQPLKMFIRRSRVQISILFECQNFQTILNDVSRFIYSD